MSTKTNTAHFSITGEFMTEHSRQLWKEREFARAFKVLECLIGSTREQQEGILMGQYRLEGTNELELIPDTWTPPEGYASFHEALQ